MVSTDHIPNPPRIPLDPDPNTNKISHFWQENCLKYRYPIDKLSGQFFPARIGLYGELYDKEPRLGPPNDTHCWSLLLHKYGLQVLNAAGFLNHDGSEKVQRVECDIHPALKMDRWPGISVADYELLKPTLMWVSAVLNDTEVLPFFAALMFQPVSVGQSATIGTYPIFRPQTTLSKADLLRAKSSLDGMKKYLTWAISVEDKSTEADSTNVMDLKFASDGHTEGHSAKPGNSAGTCCAHIQVNYTFVDNLRQYTADHIKHREFLRQCQVQYLIDADRRVDPPCEHSAFLRTSFAMGVTMLHEFTHAVCFAFSPPSSNAQGVVFDEPYYCDEQTNEAGFAFEHFLFKGYSKFMNGVCDETVKSSWRNLRAGPLGLNMRTVRDLNETILLYPTLPVTGPPDPNLQHHSYPVPQHYVNKVLSEGQWKDGQSARFGAASTIALPRLEKWKVQWHEGDQWVDVDGTVVITDQYGVWRKQPVQPKPVQPNPQQGP